MNLPVQMRAAVRATRLAEALSRMNALAKVRLHAKRAIVHCLCAIIIAALLYAIVIVANFSWKVI